ncbi:YheU family protein [Geobacter sp. DSM 9736]|uniref:YheU family protein n=1 Tax=Geobacter sp. DSM 9736 TaxID=1277350 RepID=UPI000B5091A6|nr:YheU family protein [Geobacter sp. DSM 9736]
MAEEIIRVDTEEEQGKPPAEVGIEIPLERINPDTLRNMLAEFVTREWVDEECSLETRIQQVLRQLRERKAKIVYDLGTESWNIVECR